MVTSAGPIFTAFPDIEPRKGMQLLRTFDPASAKRSEAPDPELTPRPPLIRRQPNFSPQTIYSLWSLLIYRVPFFSMTRRPKKVRRGESLWMI
jgi:hypothetical protein